MTFIILVSTDSSRAYHNGLLRRQYLWQYVAQTKI